jgi:hypothetical protein
MNVETKAATAPIEMPLAPNNLPAVTEPAKQERKPRLPKVIGPAPVYSGKIAKSVIAVTREIGRIQKDGENQFQRYKYTRWEDINEKLSPLLVEHGLIITQNEISRDVIERSQEGCVLAIVYHFTLVNEDGEAWPPVEWTAIARLTDKKGTPDDKAASKCHTQAEKGFCLKQFKIRTDEYVEGDAHESLPKKDARDIYTKLQAEIDACQSAVELGAWGADNAERIKVLPRDWQGVLRNRYGERKAEFMNSNVEWTEEDVVDPKTGEVVA